jgi:hypothetical protein
MLNPFKRMEIQEGDERLEKLTESLHTRAESARLIKKSLETAKSIENDYDRSHALSSIAQAQAEAGDEGYRKTFAMALETARSIENDAGRSRAFSSIAQAQAKAGDFASALKTARSIEEIEIEEEGYNIYLNRALLSIAQAQVQAQAKAGDFASALKTARSIEDNSYRSKALSSIAQAQAQSSIELLKRNSPAPISFQDKIFLLNQAKSKSLARVFEELGSISSNSELRVLSEQVRLSEDEIDLLESGYIKGHVLTAEQKQKYFGRFANKLEDIVSDPDPGYAVNRLVNEVLIELGYGEHGETREFLKGQAHKLSPESRQLHRLIKSLAELPDDNARHAALQLSAQKRIPDKIFKYILKKLVQVKYLPATVLKPSYIASPKNTADSSLDNNLSAFKKLIRDFPQQVLNIIQVFNDNQELKKSLSGLAREYPILSSALKDLGSITPILYLKYKQSTPEERAKLVEKIKQLKPKFFRNQNIDDLLDEEDQDILAEMVYLAYKPVGMVLADVADLLHQIKDHTKDLEDYDFPADGYAFNLGRRLKHVLKPGETLDPKLLDRTRFIFSASYPERQPQAPSDRLPKALEEVRDTLISLAKASTTLNDEDLRQILSLMANEPLVKDFAAKRPLASKHEDVFSYLENARELLGVYFNDNYGHCLERFLNQNPEVLEAVQKVLSDTKRVTTLKQRIKGMKKDSRDIAETLDFENTSHDIARLLTDYLSVALIKKLTASIKKEQGKYKAVEAQEQDTESQNITKPKTKAYISKNRASFFAKASAGLCTAQDIPLFERPDHFHINIVENEELVRANIQAYIINYPEGKKSLLLRGFNPNIKYLEGLNINAFCDEVIAIAKRFQADNHLDSVFITEPLGYWHALSNRDSVQDHLVKKFCKPEHEVEFDFNITSGTKIGRMYRV